MQVYIPDHITMKEKQETDKRRDLAICDNLNCHRGYMYMDITGTS